MVSFPFYACADVLFGETYHKTLHYNYGSSTPIVEFQGIQVDIGKVEYQDENIKPDSNPSQQKTGVRLANMQLLPFLTPSISKSYDSVKNI